MLIDIDQFVGSRVRTLRKSNDITQQELANRAGLAVQTISRLENARIGLNVANLSDVCRGLGVTLAEFFQGFGDDPKATTPAEVHRVVQLMQKMTPAGRVAVLKTAEAIAGVEGTARVEATPAALNPSAR